jgi:nucleoside-diphosphate-sugar epimerase
MFHQLYRLSVAVARPAMVYGPGQWDTTKVLPYTITSLLAGVSPSVSAGTQRFDWIFGDDVVDGLQVLAASDIAGGAVDIGTGRVTSVRDTLEEARSFINSPAPINYGTRPNRPFDQMRAARVGQTAELIGWSPSTRLRDGLRQTVAWYRESWSSSKQV